MDVEGRNVAVIQRVYDSVKLGDFEAIYRLFHPEIVLEEPDSLPYGGIYVGIDGFKRHVEKSAAVLSEFAILSTDLTGKGNRVVSVFRVRVGGKAADASLETEVVELFDLEDGLITRIKPFYFDTHALVNLLCPT